MKRTFNFKNRKRIEQEKADALERLLERVNTFDMTLKVLSDNVTKLKDKEEKREEKEAHELLEKHRKESDKTRWNKADKYRLVYDANKELTSVFINDKQMYGIADVSIDFDGKNQCPRITLIGYGSIETECGNVTDFEKGVRS